MVMFALIGALVLVPAVIAADLVVNGGFEDALNGWNQSGGTGSASILRSPGWDEDADYEVRLYRFLHDDYAEISQNVAIPRGCRVGFRAKLTGEDQESYGSGWAEVRVEALSASQTVLGTLVFISRLSNTPGNSDTVSYQTAPDDGWNTYSFLLDDQLRARLPAVSVPSVTAVKFRVRVYGWLLQGDAEAIVDDFSCDADSQSAEINIEQPVAGQQAPRGQVLRVVWSASGASTPSWVFALNKEQFLRMIHPTPVAEGQGRWHADWTVPEDLADGCDYTIWVKDDASGANQTSEAFCIGPPIPPLVIEQPVAGQQAPRGQVLRVVWSASGASTPSWVFALNKEQFLRMIHPTPVAEGEGRWHADWTVPEDLADGCDYTIWVKDDASGANQTSEAFCIGPPIPPLVIEQPVAGQQAPRGQVLRVVWSASGASTPSWVFALNKEQFLRMIHPTPVAEGEGRWHADWAVPEDLADGCDYTIWVKDDASGANQTSEAFCIGPPIPPLVIEQPVAGQQAPRGQVLRVVWSASGASTPSWVFALNKEQFLRMIQPTPVAEGQGRWHADWTVPEDLADGCDYTIWVKDDASGANQTSEAFCIGPPIPPLVIEQPVAGQQAPRGHVLRVVWSASGASTPSWVFALNKEQFLRMIHPTPVAEGEGRWHADWAVPEDLADGCDYTIWVKDDASGANQTSEAFCIGPPIPPLVIEQPVAGQQAPRGQVLRVVWSASGASTPSWVFALNKEQFLRMIHPTPVAEGEGRWHADWAVPEDLADGCDYTIWVKDDASGANQTSEAFCIGPPIPPLVIEQPVAGQQAPRGQVLRVVWSASGASTPSWVFALNKEQFLRMIHPTPVAEGEGRWHADWAVPEDLADGCDYTIWVKDDASGANQISEAFCIGIVPVLLSPPARLLGGTLQLECMRIDQEAVSAPDVSSYTLQVSNDLAEWTDAPERPVLVDGRLRFEQKMPPASGPVFFRVVRR